MHADAIHAVRLLIMPMRMVQCLKQVSVLKEVSLCGLACHGMRCSFRVQSILASVPVLCHSHAPSKPAGNQQRPCDPCCQAAMRRLELLDTAASAAAAAVSVIGGGAEAAAERAAALLDALHDMLRSASSTSSLQGGGLATAAN